MKAMDYSNGHTGIIGAMTTFSLWIWSKFFMIIGAVTIAHIASGATILSALIVAVANFPRALQAIKEFLKRKQ